MTLHDPMATADDLWRRLAAHQPAVAAALALKVRDMPADWVLRELGVSRPEAALTLPFSDPEHRVEIEPYDGADWENCPACGESIDDFCRYHRGYMAGYDALHRPLLDAVTLDIDVPVRVALQRLADDDNDTYDGEAALPADQTSKEVQG
ncbi:hypothetical protein ACFWBC_10295 [Streptomyces sp. NPDC059985]|uniref:hypothetical protein n=1 Tax=Streptomyces sp. NPDC059985 TaxID=3347025 RepID=UPI00367554C8